MKIIDLTHWIEPGMPVYPGTEAPVLEAAHTIAQHGFAEKKLSIYSHVGTHMDAPAHMLAEGRTLDSYPISSFFGRAVLADFSARRLGRIELADLLPYARQLQGVQFLILKTGWGARWGSPDYYKDFPALSPAAADWLVQTGVRGLGTDTISIDLIDDLAFPVHLRIFAAELFAIENLANLDLLPAEFDLGCFPLAIRAADGAPARVAAWVEDSLG
jgi:arylformamidase